jgi:hypothetical protein
VSARSAHVQVSAQHGGPALLDGHHYLALLERRRVLAEVGFARSPKDVSDLETWPSPPTTGRTRLDVHGALPGRGVPRFPESVERTLDLPKATSGHPRVVSRRLDVGMPEQRLKHPDVLAIFE